MTISGVVSWKQQEPGALDLSGVSAVLAPHGRRRHWSGTAAGLEVEVASHERPAGSSLTIGGSESLVLCLDAHLHRRGALAGRLGCPASSTDGELVLAAYERWGRSLVDHLSGPFAFALVDRRRGGVLLARDHAGGRGLAVHEREGRLAFATSALALSGLPGVGPDLDLERAQEVLLLAYGTERTFVRGVRAVLPGTASWIDGGGVRTWRWWLPQELPVRDAGSLRAHADELREVLEEAVASALDGAAAVGAMLSGGLDSSSVAAVAARRLAPATLASFTSVPPAGWSGTTAGGWIPDERFAVEALAARTPELVPSFVAAPVRSLFEHDEALWELGSPPARNPLNLIWVHACYERAAAAGLDVVLTGSAGNFAFSADGPLWLAHLVRRGRLLAALDEARRFSSAFDVGLGKVLRRDLLGPLLPGVRARRAARHGASPVDGWVAATAIRREGLAGLDVEAVLPEVVDPHPNGFTRDTGRMFLGAAAHAEMYAAIRVRWGIELRDPTADRRLVELAVTQPEWWRRHDGVWRAICREAMRDVLPAEIVDRQTLGAQQPDWLDLLTAAREEIRAELEEMRGHGPSYDLIDVERLEGLLASWPDRSRMADPRVVRDYQLALGRAMSLSRYLRWFEGRAARVRAGGPAVVFGATG